MNNLSEEKQRNALLYYNKISSIYDYISNWYYINARKKAVAEIELKKGKTVLNMPCGTGVNFKYFEKYMANTGLIIAIDLSNGMLSKAKNKIRKNNWGNVELINNNHLI